LHIHTHQTLEIVGKQGREKHKQIDYVRGMTQQQLSTHTERYHAVGHKEVAEQKEVYYFPKPSHLSKIQNIVPYYIGAFFTFAALNLCR
jgi:hypothetical protein